MILKSVSEFEKEFDQLISLVEGGETVVISRDGKNICEMRPISETQSKRKFGVAAGKISFAPDFDECDDEIKKLFYDESSNDDSE